MKFTSVLQVSYHREDSFSFIIIGYIPLRCRVNESLMNPNKKDPLAGKLLNATLKSVRPGSADSLNGPSCRIYDAVPRVTAYTISIFFMILILRNYAKKPGRSGA